MHGQKTGTEKSSRNQNQTEILEIESDRNI